MGKIWTKYAKREVWSDLIYVPIFLGVLWFADTQGWVQFGDAVIEFLMIGTVAGIVATLISVWWNK